VHLRRLEKQMTPAAGNTPGPSSDYAAGVWARHLFLNPHHQNTFLNDHRSGEPICRRDLLPLGQPDHVLVEDDPGIRGAQPGPTTGIPPSVIATADLGCAASLFLSKKIRPRVYSRTGVPYSEAGPLRRGPGKIVPRFRGCQERARFGLIEPLPIFANLPKKGPRRGTQRRIKWRETQWQGKPPLSRWNANRLAMVMRYLWLPRRRCERKTPGQWLLRFPTPGPRRYANDPLPSSALILRPPANERTNGRRRSKAMFGETWTPEQDLRLLEMKAAGAQVALIAKVLKRTEAATTGRLITLRKRASGSALA
jgi:hypothetical protein